MLQPASALLINRDRKPVQTKVDGAADTQSGRKIIAKTNFRLASITKQFTATAILLLASDGNLTIDDLAAKHLPAWPPFAAGVTIRHLLTHTSGLPDYDNDVPASPPQLSDADVLAFVQKQQVQLFAPGAKYSYSNTGCAILAPMSSTVTTAPNRSNRGFRGSDVRPSSSGWSLQLGTQSVPSRDWRPGGSAREIVLSSPVAAAIETPDFSRIIA
jgi:hypothetical protein